jgi:hypothetical protein
LNVLGRHKSASGRRSRRSGVVGSVPSASRGGSAPLTLPSRRAPPSIRPVNGEPISGPRRTLSATAREFRGVR